MKLSNILTLAFLTSTVSAGTPCGLHKRPGVLNAIGKFCTNAGIVVPSTYAKNGASSAQAPGKVWIKGTCNPSQWVPKEYCISQFMAMCSNGRRVRKFGRNKCQTWRIKYPKKKKPAKSIAGGKKLGSKPVPAKKPQKPQKTFIRNL